MPQQSLVTIENNFTKGLITESTGLNFPENAATDTDNCLYTLVGDVSRRLGIDLEFHYANTPVFRTNAAMNNYVWKNVGGDGLTELLVSQVGGKLYFYSITSATNSSPLSNQLLSSTVSLTSFAAVGATFDATQECQFADGNGYLFIFHPNCDPIYCTYVSGVVTPTSIIVQTRDFSGVLDGLSDTDRPSSLTNPHNYNLVNQGWALGNAWFATSTTAGTFSLGTQTFTVQAGLTITPGQGIILSAPYLFGTGTGSLGATVTSYSGTTLVFNAFALGGGTIGGQPATNWTIVPDSPGLVTQWFTATGNYPSNSDVWWYFKDSTDIFNPTATAGSVSVGSRAPRGHIILNEFVQTRSGNSTISGLNDVTTLSRPTNGTWFQGRVWYTGVTAAAAATSTTSAYTWTENIYFSQIVLNPVQFGECYQANDPTSEQLFDLLPSDGGVIVIQGSGTVYRLFPIQNGMLVFASNGVWFITGSTGIGFTANDYTVTKISSVRCLSSTSFIEVMGLPYFWNNEGIYSVQPKQGGGLSVEPLTVGTILRFYNEIPLSAKRYARGDYDPVNYVIQWVYKDTEATSVADRYNFNKILNYNVYNKAFYPYTVDNSSASINGIRYVSGPGGLNIPEPVMKYVSSYSGSVLQFSEERSTTYTDWASVSPVNYISYFITGYKLRGQAIKRFQPQYVQMYSRVNGEPFAYKIQSLWDFSNSGDSGRWSTSQLISNNNVRYDTAYRRHRLRGHGYALQFKISSVDGMPFDLQGWAVTDTVNAGT